MDQQAADSEHGYLIVNLGTPDAPDPASVGRYLREFLGDPRVIDIPAIPRFILVNALIVPRRKHQSAEAYRKVWTERGSPLMEYTQAIVDQLAGELATDNAVLAMRYGNPSIASGLQELTERGCRTATVVPLFPQYAEATTGSLVAEVERCASRLKNAPALTYLPDFYDAPGFIDAQAALAREHADVENADLVLFSFHGLPERQIAKCDLAGVCLKPGCCEQIREDNARCYRAQCHATARALADALGLEESRWKVTFQSRLGRAKWIEPYTDETVKHEVANGLKHLVVLSPAFVCDCLETIEELGMALREDFVDGGGETFELVPCVNGDPRWVRGLAGLIRTSLATV